MSAENKQDTHSVFVDCEPDWPHEQTLRHVIQAGLAAQGVQVPCEVAVCITDDEGIHQVNLETRGVDSPTDVLSFPMFELAPGDQPLPQWADPGTDRVFLGDMMISLARAEEQAKEYGHSIERELCYLSVHSLLHLLGYDHMDEGTQKERMRAREEAILGELGIVRDEPAQKIESDLPI